MRSHTADRAQKKILCTQFDFGIGIGVELIDLGHAWPSILIVGPSRTSTVNPGSAGLANGVVTRDYGKHEGAMWR